MICLVFKCLRLVKLEEQVALSIYRWLRAGSLFTGADRLRIKILWGSQLFSSICSFFHYWLIFIDQFALYSTSLGIQRHPDNVWKKLTNKVELNSLECPHYRQNIVCYKTFSWRLYRSKNLLTNRSVKSYSFLFNLSRKKYTKKIYIAWSNIAVRR